MESTCFNCESREFAHRIEKCARNREDVTLFGVDYMPYPLDAEGVPIHIGDVLDPPADCDDYTPLLVMRLTYDGYEQEWFFDGDVGGFCGLVAQHMDVAGWTHRHKPTIEDVLLEFACAGIHIAEEEGIRAGDFGFSVDKEALAEFAAKLQLKED